MGSGSYTWNDSLLKEKTRNSSLQERTTRLEHLKILVFVFVFVFLSCFLIATVENITEPAPLCLLQG